MWGKVIGACIGFAVLKVPGLVIGFFLGHWFDRSVAQDFSRGGWSSLFFEQSNITGKATFFYALFSTLGHVAKAKGRVTEQDIAHVQQLMERLELRGEVMDEAKQAFREGKQATFPLDKTLKGFREDSRGRRDVLILLMEQLISVALADNQLDKAEYEVLLRSARALGFNKFQLDQWLLMSGASERFNQSQQRGQRSKSSRRQGSGKQSSGSQSSGNQGSGNQDSGRTGAGASPVDSDIRDAYQLLGVEPGASDNELKRAHRKLMRQHHPDKLAAQGLPPEMMKAAKERTQTIQAAYDLIRKSR